MHSLGVVVAALVVASATAISNLILLNGSYAKCLDGTNPGYYFKQGTVNSVVLWFEGGGWCNSLSNCYDRSTTRLGSSSTWSPTSTFGGILNEDADINPDFHAWSTVYVKYCDGECAMGRELGLVPLNVDPFTGSSFTSDVAAPVPFNSSISLFYRGRATLDALLRDLRDNHGLATAQALVVSGSSAGGLSTYLHVDFLAAELPGVTVVGVPDAGFFPLSPDFSGAYTFTGDTLDWMVTAFNISSADQVNAGCFAATPSSALAACLSAPMFYPRIESPLFVVNSMEDWAQLTGWANLVSIFVI